MFRFGVETSGVLKLWPFRVSGVGVWGLGFQV